MDNLTLAQKFLGKEKTTENSSQAVNSSNASIVYMIAVTSSSGGEVVLMDEVEATAEWEDEDIVEIDEDGDFEDYETDDDPLEDVDDTVVDLTDGDGVDIEDTTAEVVSFSVSDYHEAAVAAYTEEIEVEEDDLPDEDAIISDEIDDGDATELPDEGEAEEDDLPDEDATIDELVDDDYTIVDADSDDESDDPVEGAEISDGYTVAECIGTVKAGDRVAVAIQDGKMIVIGVVGAGDEEEALRRQAQETADEATEAADAAQLDATQAKEAAEQAKEAADDAAEQASIANTAANNAQTAANNAQAEAEQAAAKADDAKAKADSVEIDLSAVTTEVSTVKEDAAKLRSDLEGQIQTITTTLEVSYATKDEISNTETTLRAEFEESIAGIQTTFGQTYAKKTEVDGAVAEAKADLQSQITVNASGIATVVKSVEEIEVDITDQNGKIANAIQTASDAQTVANQAKTDAQEAETAANEAKSQAATANTAATKAQAAATEAKSKAETAETELAEAKANLEEAEQKLAEVEANAAANAEDIEQAQQAVEAAQAAVKTAQDAADEAKADAAAAQGTADKAVKDAAAADAAAAQAQTSADAAQNAADAAQAAADEAKKDLAALNSRVELAETSIQQNSEAIALRATKTELQAVNNNLSNNYYTKTQTDAEIKELSDSITLSVSSVRSEVEATQAQFNALKIGARIKICEDKITSQVSVTDGLTTRMSAVEQTASGLTVSLSTTNNNVTAAANAAANAQTTADTAKANAATAQSTANTARTEAANAAKTATNYLKFNNDGLVVGDLTASTLGKNVLINSETVNIRNGSDVLASFGANTITLGNASDNSKIYLCGDVGYIYASKYGDSDFFDRLGMSAPNLYLHGESISLNVSTQYGNTSESYSDSAHSTIATYAYHGSEDSYASGYIRSVDVASSHTAQVSANAQTGSSYVTLSATDSSDIAEVRLSPTRFTIGPRTLINDDLVVTGVTELGGHLYFTENNLAIYAIDTSGNNRNVFQPLNASGNTVLGYGNYSNSSGNTDIYGNGLYLYSKNTIVANRGIRSSGGLYTNGKTDSDDGTTGGYLSATGRLHLQNTTANPYVGFYGTDTTYGAYISYQIDTDFLEFGNALRYVFKNFIYTASAIRIGCDDTADSMAARAISTMWADGSAHNIVERGSSGLTAAFGWAGKADYATVTTIRGRTCKYSDSSGTTTLSDERLKKDFTKLDKWDAFFDALEPCAFRMKNGNSGRFHIGFKAGQVEQALIDNGLTTQDFAGFVRMAYLPNEDDSEGCKVYEEAGINPGDDELGLIYGEFPALNTYQIQQLKTAFAELKREFEEFKTSMMN